MKEMFDINQVRFTYNPKRELIKLEWENIRHEGWNAVEAESPDFENIVRNIEAKLRYGGQYRQVATGSNVLEFKLSEKGQFWYGWESKIIMWQASRKNDLS